MAKEKFDTAKIIQKVRAQRHQQTRPERLRKRLEEIVAKLSDPDAEPISLLVGMIVELEERVADLEKRQ